MAKTTHIQARVTPALKQVVATRALWESCSKSTALRAIIAEYGQRHGILPGNGDQQAGQPREEVA